MGSLAARIRRRVLPVPDSGLQHGERLRLGLNSREVFMIATLPASISVAIREPSTGLVRLHVGLYVADLTRASAFFRVLFNAEPRKDYADYVHFESDDPPVVLALSPGGRRPGGTLNHIGLRLPSAESLVDIQKRLEQAGYKTQRQEGVACCYALQTKFWVTDPDHNLWEIYTLQTDLNRNGFDCDRVGAQILGACSGADSTQ
jgi:catechol 2,3-dioxygenase-like lactoylglutathione lyase family enzyme